MQDNLDIKLMSAAGYTNSNIVLNSQVKLSIVFVLIFLLKTNFLVSELLHNVGLPYLRFQKLIFFILPGIYIYLTAKVNNNIRLRNFFVVFIFIIMSYFLEKYVHGYNNDPGAMDQINRWIYIYIGYLILINVGVKYLEFILKSVITLILINSLLIYLDFFGVINVANISKGSGDLGGRLNSVINLNIFSDINILAIFCVYWLSYMKSSYTFLKLNIPKYFYLIFFLGLTFLQATRGSFLILLFGFLLYAYDKWIYWNIKKKIILIFIMIILFFLESNILAVLTENFSIFQRFSSSTVNLNEAEVLQDGRLLQIFSSYQNFLSSPFIGVGFRDATSGFYDGIVRSNFQYTQILASGGLILFVFYLLMIFKLFGYSLKLIKHDLLVKSCIIFVLISLTFRRPDMYFAILGSVVFYKHLLIKRKRL